MIKKQQQQRNDYERSEYEPYQEYAIPIQLEEHQTPCHDFNENEL